MQSSPTSLSEKFVTPINGASVVASSNGNENLRWKHISVSSVDGLISIIDECASSGINLLCGEPQALPVESDLASQYVFVDLKPMNKILRHEAQDLVVSVQTGITIGALNQYLQGFGQWFPVAASSDAILLDLINCGYAGLLEHGFGTIRDNVLGLEVVTGGGAAIKTGGIVVKNVTGYDTTKLFVGSRATLGIPHVAHLRLYASPERSATLLFQANQPDELITLANDLIKADLSLVSCELLDLGMLKKSTRLNENLSKLATTWQACGLLVRVSGHEELLKELVPQICHFKNKDSSELELNSEDADRLLELCSHLLFPRIEMSVSVSQARSILSKWWKQKDKAAFQFRPSTGRFQIISLDATTHSDMAKSLREFTDAPNTVALLSGPIEYRVDTVGTDLKKLTQIKASLKDKFDPARCLNPLAVL
ncbi:MAG TPA: FAD-binding oxidoreductase [Drouetiella sp.]